MTLTIDNEFKNLIPPLTPDERKGLEESILAEGCRDALIAWNGVLVDGHNRYEICEKYGLPYAVTETDFASREAVIEWIIKNQFSRRNLPLYERARLALRLKPVIAERAKENQGTRTDILTNLSKGFNPTNTRQEVAAASGVSEGTLAKVEKIEANASEKTKEALRRGEMSINQAYTELQKPHVAFNSGNNEWYTPSEYIEAARAVMGSIDLDPASSVIANKTVKADHIYTVEDNGLEKPWFGNVWLNPPYASDLIGKFAEKVVNELGNIKQAIVLVNNATETEWFYGMVTNATAVCFPKSRVKFYTPDGKTGAPLQGQAIIYFGEYVNRFINVFDEKGWCARL